MNKKTLKNYVNDCIDDYFARIEGYTEKVRVRVDAIKQIVQVNNIFYDSAVEKREYNGISIGVDVEIENWEEDIRDIDLRQDVKAFYWNYKCNERRIIPFVGLFFYVNNQLLYDAVDIEHAEKYGDFLIGRTSHDQIWNEKYMEIYNKPYDYFPRGRVVYKASEDTFILYLDSCIDMKGAQEILDNFKLHNETVEVDRTDEHYVCKSCNENFIE